MDRKKIDELGDELYRALRTQVPVDPLTARIPDINIDDAYLISLRLLHRRQAEDGETVIGKKIGVTSKAVQEMLNVHQPDFGFLTDAMEFVDGGRIPIAGHLIHPRAEGEIGFRLKRDLVGPGITEADVLNATDYIFPCFEIVDSRIRDWKIKIEDTVADNASCGAFVQGTQRADPRKLDLAALQLRIWKNGALLSQGMGSAVQGNPLTAVAWLANTLGRYGIPFKAGEVILSGSLVPLEDVAIGDRMELELEGVGGASVQFV
jgi:2-oxopent-4-enoate/cis-2-oxohex-4-enoate hydratase